MLRWGLTPTAPCPIVIPMNNNTDRYLDRTTTDIDECLSIYVRALSAANEIHLSTRFPGFEPYTFGYDAGRKYNRVWLNNGTQTMVVCFVQRDNGDVWKAAGWKAPALNFTRGNIMTPEGRLALTFGKISETGYFSPSF